MEIITWSTRFRNVFVDLNKRIKLLEEPVNDFIMDFFDDPLYSFQSDSSNLAGRMLLQPQTTLTAPVYLSRQWVGLFDELSQVLQGLFGVLSCKGFVSHTGNLNGCFVSGWRWFNLWFGRLEDTFKDKLAMKAHYRESATYNPGESNRSVVTKPKWEWDKINVFGFTYGNNPVAAFANLMYPSVNLRIPFGAAVVFTFVTGSISSFAATANHALSYFNNLISKMDNWKLPALDPFLTILAEKNSLWSSAHPWTNPGKYL